MAQTRLANPQVLINNNPIAIVANSLTFKEGLGEQNVTIQSAGGNHIETVYSEDVSTRMSMVKFDLASTEQNIELIRNWKLARNENAIVVTGTEFTRTFTNMALITDYEVGLGNDSVISLEFHGDPAV